MCIHDKYMCTATTLIHVMCLSCFLSLFPLFSVDDFFRRFLRRDLRTFLPPLPPLLPFVLLPLPDHFDILLIPLKSRIPNHFPYMSVYVHRFLPLPSLPPSLPSSLRQGYSPYRRLAYRKLLAAAAAAVPPPSPPAAGRKNEWLLCGWLLERRGKEARREGG